MEPSANPAKIRVEAGEYTEELKNYIFQNLTDEDALRIELEQERSIAPGLAREPITIAFVLILGGKAVAETAVGTALVLTIGSLIERWMDQREDRRKLDQAINIYDSDPELGKLLLKHLDRFSAIAIKNEIRPSPETER
jgi:hypothetical protein